ncbi:hypothetical protein [Thioalkalivibrio sp. ALJT]|uniref:hypothetical protein n=1 Tax=Thioalkalivibrio sp. ALJT TaxID=1158146 RepID=UPI00035E2551|nr:hypothetical protein [Thioalkalivibrio sp. ALJT]
MSKSEARAGREGGAERTPAILFLANLSDKPLDSWLKAAALEAEQPWSESVVSNIAGVKKVLEQYPFAHVVVSYTSPDEWIARLLTAGLAPSRALESWRNDMDQLLALYGQHHSRLTLVRWELLLERSAWFMEQLSERSGIHLREPGAVTVPPLEEAQGESRLRVVMHRLLALQALDQGQAFELVKEVEACSLPLDKKAAGLDALDQWYDELEDLREEMLSVVVENKHGESESELERVREENAILLEQLHQVQETLERNVRAKNEQVGRIKNLEADIYSKKAKLKEIYGSRSWKITAPLRKTLNVFRGRKST